MADISLSFLVKEIGDAQSQTMKLMQASRSVAEEAKKNTNLMRNLTNQQIDDLRKLSRAHDLMDKGARKASTNVIEGLWMQKRAIEQTHKAVKALAGTSWGAPGGPLASAMPFLPGGAFRFGAGGLGARLGGMALGSLTGLIGTAVAAMGAGFGAQTYLQRHEEYNQIAQVIRRAVGPLAGMGNPAMSGAITRGVLGQSVAFGTSPEEIAAAQVRLFSEVGGNQAAIKGISQEAMLLAKAKGIPPELAMQLIGKGYSIFGGGNLGGLSKMTGQLSKAMNMGSWSPQEFAQFFPGYASTVKSQGLGIEQILGLAVAGSRGAGSPEQLFTGLRNFVMGIPMAVEKGSLQRVGGENPNLEQAVQQMLKMTDKQFKALTTPGSGFEKETISTVSRIRDHWDEYLKFVKDMAAITEHTLGKDYYTILKNDAIQAHAETMNILEQRKTKLLAETGPKLTDYEVEKLATREYFSKIGLGNLSHDYIINTAAALSRLVDKLGGASFALDEFKKQLAADIRAAGGAAAEPQAAMIEGTIRGDKGFLGWLGSWLPGGQVNLPRGVLPAPKTVNVDGGGSFYSQHSTEFLLREMGIRSGAGPYLKNVPQSAVPPAVSPSAPFRFHPGFGREAAYYRALERGGYLTPGRWKEIGFRDRSPEGPLTPEEAMQARFIMEAQGIRSEAMEARSRIGMIPFKQRRNYMRGISRWERDQMRDVQEDWEEASEGTPWGIRRRAIKQANEERNREKVEKMSLYYKYGARTEDELIQKIVDEKKAEADPRSFQSRLKAALEEAKVGTVNMSVDKANISVTGVGAGNATTQAAMMNYQRTGSSSLNRA